MDIADKVQDIRLSGLEFLAFNVQNGYNLWQVDKLRSAQSEEEWKALLFTLAEQLNCRVKQRSVQNAVRYCEKCLAIKPDRCVQCCSSGSVLHSWLVRHELFSEQSVIT